jgi:hypothetical protein
MPPKFAARPEKIKQRRFNPKAANGEITAAREVCPGKKPAPGGEN